MHEIQLDTSPYQRFLGLELLEQGEGTVTLRLPFREELLREDGSDWIHGGVLSALADIAGDYAIVTRTGFGVPTIDLRIDWLRPARAGDLIARARAVKVGRMISVADIEIEDRSGKIVTVARGTYANPQRLSSSATSHERGEAQPPEPTKPAPPTGASSNLSGSRLNDIGVLRRREIEARIVAPFVEELARTFERQQILEILSKVVVEIAHSQGSELATSMGGCSLHHLSDSLENWKKDDALELEVLEESEDRLFFNVTRCRYAELYQSLGIPELGRILSCNRDEALIEGFNPELALGRRQTILEGASHCDFRYEKKTQREG